MEELKLKEKVNSTPIHLPSAAWWKMGPLLASPVWNGTDSDDNEEPKLEFDISEE